MTFLELAKERYSVRSFQKKMIDDEELEKILEAGNLAPTACNKQPQKVYVVKSEELRKALSEVSPCTFGAPLILVLGYDTSLDWKNKRMPGYSSGETDTAIVGTHMMLEAWELGIGSCWVGMFRAEDVARVLQLPENIRVTALMPMGYPTEEAKPIELHSMYRDKKEWIEIR